MYRPLSILLLLLSIAAAYDIKHLAHSRTWLGLLHYDGNRSSVISDGFFLDPKGGVDPERELHATIRAFEKQEAICRYPARYLYLSHETGLFDAKVLTNCKQMQSWRIIRSTTAVSAVFVSGFLGNPASAFGHSFLRMRNPNSEDGALFDITISYGAQETDQNNMLLYIYRGTTGGYVGNFSDKYFYMDAMVYSNSEYREMWEYEIVLSDYQRQLLLYHLWELRGVDFRYYFFHRNCGYQLSALLDTVIEESVTEDADVWYAPAETFYRLKELGKIAKIHYHPSQQQEIYAFYRILTPREKEVVSDMITHHVRQIPTAYTDLTVASRQKILDFVIAFEEYAYKHADAGVLADRMLLPASEYTVPAPPRKRDITESDRVRYGGVALQRSEGRDSLVMSFGAFAIESVGYNWLEGDRMKVANLQVAVSQDRLKLQQVDIIDIRRLKINTIPFDKANPLSWELKVAYQDYHKATLLARGGVGYSVAVSKKSKWYAMADLEYLSHKNRFYISPYLGLFSDMGRMRIDMQAGVRYDTSWDLKKKLWYQVEGQYRLRGQKACFIDFSDRKRKYIRGGIKWFF